MVGGVCFDWLTRKWIRGSHWTGRLPIISQPPSTYPNMSHYSSCLNNDYVLAFDLASRRTATPIPMDTPSSPRQPRGQPRGQGSRRSLAKRISSPRPELNLPSPKRSDYYVFNHLKYPRQRNNRFQPYRTQKQVEYEVSCSYFVLMDLELI